MGRMATDINEYAMQILVSGGYQTIQEPVGIFVEVTPEEPKLKLACAAKHKRNPLRKVRNRYKYPIRLRKKHWQD